MQTPLAIFGLSGTLDVIIQLVILGALGEFTHRIYRLVQGLPLFEVAHVHRRPGADS